MNFHFDYHNDDLINAYQSLKKQRNIVYSIIHPFLLPSLTSKQRIELSHVGKFIMLLDEPASIVTQRDRPDFIISYQEENIGLEIETIVKLNKVQSIKSVEKLFEDAAELFKREHPNCNVLANCWLTFTDFKFKKSQVETLKKEIADYIYRIYSRDGDNSKPQFISKVILMKHPNVAFTYNPGAYAVNNLNNEILAAAIAKKEEKISDYRNNSKLHKQWLLIVIGSTGPQAFEMYANEINITSPSEFERIYVMEDFNGKILRVL
jgi:hypothetical protein